MPTWVEASYTQIFTGIALMAFSGATVWITWVSMRIPRFEGKLDVMVASLVNIQDSVARIPDVQNDLSDHRREDSVNFARMDERFKSMDEKIEFYRKVDEDRSRYSA